VDPLILYHTTTPERAESILREGLSTNKNGWSYLSPKPDQWPNMGSTVLEIETGDARLTAFEDCEDWEVLCWSHIPPENIRVYNKEVS
jgi:RNA:NAD 2'-phosphotransferase (TPT1/KptA family)